MYHSLSYFSKKSRSKWVFGKIFSKNPIFSYTFVQETKFLDFCESACHYDVTEAKHWACWYLFWYQCLEETLR